MTFFYPDYWAIMLFILGISVGALAPLLINELKKASMFELGLALSLSYGVGTFLFNYEPANREYIDNIFYSYSICFIIFFTFRRAKKRE